MENLQAHGPFYSQQDYSHALTVLAYSDMNGEGIPDREKAAKNLQLQLEQLDSIFSGDSV